jgi:tRNA(Arg) A34 adenosine deaminase TadA
MDYAPGRSAASSLTRPFRFTYRAAKHLREDERPTMKTTEWDHLPEHWRCAFRQAWEAYSVGTVPVGAAVVDPQGKLAAQARNRIFHSDPPPPGQIAWSWLAHAEVNAICQIDPERSRGSDGWAVYTTLEPCPLCTGAITVAFTGRITVGYASADSMSGGLGTLPATAIGRRRQWEIQKLDGPLAVFAELLLALYSLDARPDGVTAALYRGPAWQSVIQIVRPSVARARECGTGIEQLLTSIWTHLQLPPESQ